MHTSDCSRRSSRSNSMTHSNDQRHFGDQGICAAGTLRLNARRAGRSCSAPSPRCTADVRTAYDLANAAYHDYARCIIGEAENRAITELKWPSAVPETRVVFAAGTSGLSAIECWCDCRFTRESIAEAVRLDTAASGLWCTRACYACTAGATGSADPRPPAKTRRDNRTPRVPTSRRPPEMSVRATIPRSFVC